MKLKELLNGAYNGRIVLPDFQRSFVWGPEDVRELLVSVFGNYFIGSMLFLDSTKDTAPFAIRLIEGVDEINPNAKPDYSLKIVLDGQQRTTALFYAFYSPPIPLANRRYPHKFYVDILKALEGNMDDAILGLSIKDRRRIKEFKSNKYVIPVETFLDLEKLVSLFENDESITTTKVVKLYNDVMENYEIHTIDLPNDTSLDRIVETFEKLNKTGMPLSTFDLATARLYRQGINLRTLLDDAKQNYGFASAIPPEFILKVIALMRDKDPRRKNLLELEHNNFIDEWKRSCKALELAYRRITDLKNGYGVLDYKKWVPYSTLIVPVAAMIDYLITNQKKSIQNYEKIDAFYWITIFGNRYDQAVDSKSYSDYKGFINWVENNELPEFVKKFDIETVDLDISNTTSAIFKGVLSLIVLRGAYDFKTGQPPQFELNRTKVQIDHIFPKSIYHDDRLPNRTIITTNQSKSNKKPSVYFGELVHTLGKGKVIEILKTHLISEQALDYLLDGEFEEFIEDRKETILEEIKSRTHGWKKFE